MVDWGFWVCRCGRLQWAGRQTASSPRCCCCVGFTLSLRFLKRSQLRKAVFPKLLSHGRVEAGGEPLFHHPQHALVEILGGIPNSVKM